MRRLIAKTLLALSLVTGVPAADKASTVDDNYLHDSVGERLAADVTVKGGDIKVDVKDGVVTLSGIVQEPKQKAKAETIAKKVKGVKSVVNNLQIKPQ